MPVAFDVENAGCPSCAELVREALEPFGAVASIDVDEEADRAVVRLDGDADLAAVDAALARVSPEGHAYRVASGTWRAA